MTRSASRGRRLLFLFAGAIAMAITFLGVAAGATSGPFAATFDGSPTGPVSALPMLGDFDVQVHSRDSSTWYQLQTMVSDHGPDCGAPPATHSFSGSYADAVFQCKNHIMTNINAGGYGMIYLTPNEMADFSAGAAVVQWDLSTLRHSIRDFVDFWVVPYDDQFALPFDMGDVDGQGVPRQGIHIRMDQFNGETIYRGYVINNYSQTEIPGAWWSSLDSALASVGRSPSPSVRDTFRLEVSKTHVKFGAPALNWWPIDADVSELGFSQGVFQIGQHSYNPTKDNAGEPATWHWDNISIEPAVPFTIIKADQRYIDGPTQTLTFDAPAPPNSHVRFTSIGSTQVSFNGGPFQAASVAIGSAQGNHPEHLSNYWMPVPVGTTTMKMKWSPDSWYQGPYIAKDFAIWSRDVSATVPAPTLPATSTPTSVPLTNTPVAPTSTVVAPTKTPQTIPTNSPSIPTVPPGSTVVPPTSQPPMSSASRITWGGKDWYLHGANLPWYNWGCDFGCGPNGGASSSQVKSAVGAAFAQAKASGVNVVRWWVFPGDPWQINRAGNGTPTGVNPAVYTDLDAAVALAAQYDIYLDLVLFSGPSAIPSSWINDGGQRRALADALGPMFARYKNNARVMTWEVVNEPEFDIWTGAATEANTKAMVKAVAVSVHANSPALVTVGSAMVDGLSMWVDQGLDYYQAHWYDYMQPGNWCAMCSDYATIKSSYGLDKPLVIGEFFGGSSVSALQRYEDWYSKGFAGAWAWSLLTNRTSDGMSVDLAAAKSFAANHNGLGPTGGSVGNATATPTGPAPTSTPKSTTPTPTPPAVTSSPTKPAGTRTSTPRPSTATPTATQQQPLRFSSSVSRNKSSVNAGGSIKLTTRVSSTAKGKALVDVEIYGPDGTKVFQKVYDNQSFSAGSTKQWSSSWSIPRSAITGTYMVKVGVFSPGWGTLYEWNDAATTFTVK